MSARNRYIVFELSLLLCASVYAWVLPRQQRYRTCLSYEKSGNMTAIIRNEAALEVTYESDFSTRTIATGDTTSTAPSTITTSLGDIMARGLQTESFVDALTGTNENATTLATAFGLTNPLDRLVLTANGNLQRLIASYYDADVSVRVEECSFRNDNPNVWDRTVYLKVLGVEFCRAESQVTIHQESCQELVASGQVGLGQLFRYLNVLPMFSLHDAGMDPSTGGIWREYMLQCDALTCQIREEFIPGLWELDRR